MASMENDSSFPIGMLREDNSQMMIMTSWGELAMKLNFIIVLLGTCQRVEYPDKILAAIEGWACGFYPC